MTLHRWAIFVAVTSFLTAQGHVASTKVEALREGHSLQVGRPQVLGDHDNIQHTGLVTSEAEPVIRVQYHNKQQEVYRSSMLKVKAIGSKFREFALNKLFPVTLGCFILLAVLLCFCQSTSTVVSRQSWDVLRLSTVMFVASLGLHVIILALEAITKHLLLGISVVAILSLIALHCITSSFVQEELEGYTQKYDRQEPWGALLSQFSVFCFAYLTATGQDVISSASSPLMSLAVVPLSIFLVGRSYHAVSYLRSYVSVPDEDLSHLDMGHNCLFRDAEDETIFLSASLPCIRYASFLLVGTFPTAFLTFKDEVVPMNLVALLIAAFGFVSTGFCVHFLKVWLFAETQVMLHDDEEEYSEVACDTCYGLEGRESVAKRMFTICSGICFLSYALSLLALGSICIHAKLMWYEGLPFTFVAVSLCISILLCLTILVSAKQLGATTHGCKDTITLTANIRTSHSFLVSSFWCWSWLEITSSLTSVAHQPLVSEATASILLGCTLMFMFSKWIPNLS